MANINILNLPVAISLTGAEYIPLVQGLGNDARTMRAQASLVSGGAGASVQAPHSVFAGPASGIVSDYPTFRALVAADIPTIEPGNLPRGTAGYAIIGNGLASDPSYQGFTATGTGATTRTWNDKAADTVSVKDYGAVGDNVTDDSAAFQKAFDAANNVYVPQGTYYLGNTNISVSNKAFMLWGAGMGVSVLRWNGASGGITYNQNNGTRPMGLAGLSLFQQGAAQGTAFYYNGSGQISGGTIAARTYPRLTIVDVNIRGATGASTNAWERCIVGESLMRVICDRVHLQGMFSGTQDNILTPYGIYLFGAGAAVECVVTNSWANYVGSALEAATYEGVFVSNCNFVAVNKGVFYNDPSAGPQIALMNNHMSVNVCAVDCVGLNQASIQGNLFYTRAEAPGTVYGILLRDGSSLNSIVGNTFVNSGGVDYIPIQVGDGGGSAGSILRNAIHNNIFWGHASQPAAIPIHVASDASTTLISGGDYHSWASRVLDAGTGTRRWGEDDLTTVFAGNPLTLTNTTDTAINIGLTIQSDRATPTINDRIGIAFRISDDAGNEDEFGRIEAIASTITSGNEGGALRFHVMSSGALSHEMTLSPVALTPGVNDGCSLGVGAGAWSDLFLASGGVIDWANNDVRITQSTNALAFTGASSGYSFDAQITGTAPGNPARFINATDAVSNQGIRIESDRATPAGNDAIYSSYYLSDSAGNQDEMMRATVTASSVTSGAETATLQLSLINSGALTTFVALSPSTGWRPTTNDGIALGSSTFGWSDLYLATGGFIDWGNNSTRLTQGSNALTLTGAELFINRAGIGQSITNTTDQANNIALELQSDRATVTANDRVGLSFRVSDDAGNQDEAGRIEAMLSTVTSGAEQGVLRFHVITGGALSLEAQLTPSQFGPGTNDGCALGSGTNNWADLFLATGGLLDWGNNNVRFTHAANTITVTGASTNFDIQGPLEVDSLRIDQATSNIGTGAKTISNGADSSTNFGKYISISANGTTVYLPCGTVAPT